MGIYLSVIKVLVDDTQTQVQVDKTCHKHFKKRVESMKIIQVVTK